MIFGEGEVVTGRIYAGTSGEQVVHVAEGVAGFGAFAAGPGVFAVDAVGGVIHREPGGRVHVGRQVEAEAGINAGDGVADEVDFGVHEVPGVAVVEDGGGFVVVVKGVE